MSERYHQVTTRDGISLSAWIATPNRVPLATLLLCHGMTTDASEHGAFPALRDLALRSGLAVVRFDFRAHGRSKGKNEALRLEGLHADVDAVLELADREIGPDVSLIPLGLSFGGGPAIHAAATRARCVGLALWYGVIDYHGNYNPASTVPFTRRMRAHAEREPGPDWAEMPVLGTDYFFPKAMVTEMPDDRSMTELAGLAIPVLAYHGSRDTFVDLEPLRRLAACHQNIDLRIARGAGHGFLFWRPWVLRRTARWAAKTAARSTHSP